jgi:large subunit ribosomal protein L21
MVTKEIKKQAVIKTGGKQYLVFPKLELLVEKLDAKKGDKIVFDEVLTTFSGDKAEIGTPFVKTKVEAEVIDHVRGLKIKIQKYKPKTRYRRKTGHKQHYTKVKILTVN